MDKLKPREKLLLAVLLIVGVLYVYIKLLYMPLRAQITDTMTSIAKKSTINQNLTNMQAENKSLITQIKGLKSVYTASMNLLPQSEKNPEIYYNIEKMALNSKVTVSDVNLGAPAEVQTKAANGQNQQSATTTQAQGTNGQNQQSVSTAQTRQNPEKWKFMSVPVTFKVTGDYAQMLQYIHDLENDTRQCQILSVKLDSDDKTPGINAAITMCYYYMQQGTFDLKYDFNNGTYGKDTLFK